MKTVTGNFGTTYSTNGLKVGGSLVIVVIRVLDLPRSPNTLVGRVVDEIRRPLALVGRIPLHRRLPFAAARNFVTLGVGDRRRNPVTIFLIIPILGLLSLRVGNGLGLVFKPVFGLRGFFVNDLEGCILVPVVRLLGIGIRDAGLINPILRFLVVWVFNLLRGVNRRGEVFMEGSVADGLSIDLDLEALVGLDNERVEGGGLDDASQGRVLEVLLLVLAGLGVLVAEDEVDLESQLGSLKCQRSRTLLVAPHLSGPNMMM